VSVETVIVRRRDITGPVAARILRELEDSLGVDTTRGPIELRLVRDAAGVLAMATLSTQHRVEAITAVESDAAARTAERAR
jgi:hypothetical protein